VAEKNLLANPQDPTPKTLLVTGGAGFIGSNFIRYLLDGHEDVRIVNLDKLTYAGNLLNLKAIETDPRYLFVRGDIADRNLVGALLHREKPEFIVNFAAESHVDRSLLDASPFVEANIKGTQVLLDASREFGVERFIQVSTDEVYGSLEEGGLFNEASPICPNNPYSATKAAAEMLCRAYHKSYGVPAIITRSSNNYGPYQFPEKLIPLMIRNALVGKTLPIYGEGKQVRDWLFVEDNCRAIDLVLKDGEIGEVYNIGGSCEKQNVEVVEAICKTLKAKAPHLEARVEFIKDPRGAAHDFRYALDSSKMKRELGWEPKRRFEEGLEQTIEWYLGNQDWVESVVTGNYQEYYNEVYEAD
jgi:dTDP-glucose 4,6-dehydratase